MKSFFEIPLVERDPAMALVIEDGMTAGINMDGYDGLRSLAEVLSLAVPAPDIRELNAIARLLGLGQVRVLRVTDAAGFTGVLSPNDFDCLAEVGVTLFAMCEDDGDVDDHGEMVDERMELADQFIGLATVNQTSGEARWQQLVYYTAAVRQCGFPFKLPPWLKPDEAMLIAEAQPWWGLPQAASTRQAMAFAAYIADHCGKWEYITGVMRTVRDWVDAHGEPYGDFEQMFQAFKADRPLELWVRAVA